MNVNNLNAVTNNMFSQSQPAPLMAEDKIMILRLIINGINAEESRISLCAHSHLQRVRSAVRGYQVPINIYCKNMEKCSDETFCGKMFIFHVFIFHAKSFDAY